MKKVRSVSLIDGLVSAPVILSASISEMPRSMPHGMFDPMPSVTALFTDGSKEKLFSFYPDEIQFREDEFVGLTRAQALSLRHKRDVTFLRQR